MFLIVFLFGSYFERLTNNFFLFWQRKIFRKLNRHIGVRGNCAPKCSSDNPLFLSWPCPRKYVFLFYFFFPKSCIAKITQRYFSLRSLAAFAKKLNELSFWPRPSKQIPPSFPSLTFECCLLSHRKRAELNRMKGQEEEMWDQILWFFSCFAPEIISERLSDWFQSHLIAG